MKRCPECRRDYYDDSLLYCLDDGAQLLEGPASMDEPQTAILHDTDAPSEVATRAQIHTTAAEPQSKLGEPPEKPSFSANGAAKPLMIVGGVVLLLVAGFFGYRYFMDGNQINSIAVLPFVNESGDPGIEYLSDGMTETLINSLSEIPDINVKARTLVFQYKGKAISPVQLASELEVQAILTGRVIQRGDLISLSVELIDGRTQNTLWGKKYERAESGLVTLQHELARDVSGRLASKSSGGEASTTKTGGTDDPVAYQAYLKGRFYWNKRNADDLKKAIEQFKMATERDPGYALAFSGLADCYAISSSLIGTPLSETTPKAKAFAEKALSLDNTLGAPHAALGSVYMSLWDWEASEREYKAAIELDPDYPTTYHWYSILLRYLGRVDEASVMIRRAADLDPLSVIILQNVANVQMARGDFELCVETTSKVIDMDSNFAGARIRLGQCYLGLRRSADAISAFEKALELNNARFGQSELGFAYASVGRRTEALKYLSEVKARYDGKEADGKDVALIYLGLGEEDKVFEWLEKDFQARRGELPTTRWESTWAPIREDPRYLSLLTRMGLPE